MLWRCSTTFKMIALRGAVVDIAVLADHPAETADRRRPSLQTLHKTTCAGAVTNSVQEQAADGLT